MANWFSKSNQPKHNKPVEEVEAHFEITCQCGQRHQGLRRAKSQVLNCKFCGTKNFVLSRDAYPAPVGPVGSSPIPVKPGEDAEESVTTTSIARLRKRTRRNISGVNDGSAPMAESRIPKKGHLRPPIESAKQSDSKTSKSARTSNSTKSTSQRLSDREILSRQTPRPALRTSSPVQPVRPTVPPRVIGSDQFLEVRRPKKSFWKSLTFLFCLAAFLVVMTLMFLVGQISRTQAAAKLFVSKPEALSAIQAQAWDEGYQSIRDSHVSMKKLGTKSAEADMIRQYYQELTAIQELSYSSLDSLVAGLKSEFDSRPEGRNRGRNLGSLNVGQWLVLEAPVSNTSKSFWSGKNYQAETFALVDDTLQSVVIRADFPVFDHWVLPGSSPVTIFAGQFSQASYDSTTQVWTITLNRKTGFLWGHPETLEKAGFSDSAIHSDQELAVLLGEQSEAANK